MNTRPTPRLGVGNERGQILPLFAISAVVLLALAGLGLDGARVFHERRVAQGAADLAAIAGAKPLPADQSAATIEAFAVAAANGYPAGQVTVTFPEASKIRVTISSNVSMFFTSLVGITDTDVPAAAAAIHIEEVVGGAGIPLAGPAILASETVCGTQDALKWDAHDAVINGDVITNAGGDMAGSNNTLNGTESYLDDPPSCDNQFTPHANPPTAPWGVDFQPVTTPVDYPLDPTLQPFGDVLAVGGLCNAATYPTTDYPAGYLHLMDTDNPPTCQVPRSRMASTAGWTTRRPPHSSRTRSISRRPGRGATLARSSRPSSRRLLRTSI